MSLFRRPVSSYLAARKKITVLAETDELEGMQQFLSSRRMGKAVRIPDTGPYGFDPQPTATLPRSEWQKLGERAVDLVQAAAEVSPAHAVDEQTLICARAASAIALRALPEL